MRALQSRVFYAVACVVVAISVGGFCGTTEADTLFSGTMLNHGDEAEGFQALANRLRGEPIEWTLGEDRVHYEYLFIAPRMLQDPGSTSENSYGTLSDESPSTVETAEYLFSFDSHRLPGGEFYPENSSTGLLAPTSWNQSISLYSSSSTPEPSVAVLSILAVIAVISSRSASYRRNGS